MIIYSWFTYYKWWFSIAMLVYQMVPQINCLISWIIMNLTFPTKMAAEVCCAMLPCLVLLLRWCVIIYVHGILDTLALETFSAPLKAPRAPQEVWWFSPLKSSLHSASPWRKCGFRCWTQRSKWSHQKYVRSMTSAITQIVIDFFPSMVLEKDIFFCHIPWDTYGHIIKYNQKLDYPLVN